MIIKNPLPIPYFLAPFVLDLQWSVMFFHLLCRRLVISATTLKVMESLGLTRSNYFYNLLYLAFNPSILQFPIPLTHDSQHAFDGPHLHFTEAPQWISQGQCSPDLQGHIRSSHHCGQKKSPISPNLGVLEDSDIMEQSRVAKVYKDEKTIIVNKHCTVHAVHLIPPLKSPIVVFILVWLSNAH